MKECKLINLNFTYSNNNGTELFGQMLVPLIDGKVYKAFEVKVNSGFWDLSHRKLKGDGGENYRRIKDDLVAKHTVTTNDENIVKVSEPFSILPNDENIGYVKAISIFNGYSSNRFCKLLVDDSGSMLNNKFIGKLFQNAKSSPIKVNKFWKIISLQEAEKEEESYFETLSILHNANIDSCSTQEIDIEEGN